jgi:hypothetical protein
LSFQTSQRSIFQRARKPKNYTSAFAKKSIDDGKPSFHNGGGAPASKAVSFHSM